MKNYYQRDHISFVPRLDLHWRFKTQNYFFSLQLIYSSWKVRAYGIYAWVLCKHVTKHFPYGIVFSTYILRHLSFFHPFISCLSEILKCQNTPLHTTKWQRKRRILFGMYNWKWMNLSKIRQDKNVSDKKYNLSLRLVLFCSLPRFF